MLEIGSMIPTDRYRATVAIPLLSESFADAFSGGLLDLLDFSSGMIAGLRDPRASGVALTALCRKNPRSVRGGLIYQKPHLRMRRLKIHCDPQLGQRFA